MLVRRRAPFAAKLPPRALILTLLLAAALPLLFAAVATAKPGDTIWVRQFTTSSGGDAFMDLARGPGDVYYCTGIARATEETSSLVLVKYKADGTRLWSRIYTSPTAKGAAAAAVAVAPDGDVLVAGTIGVAPPASWKGRDIVVLRFEPDGSREWVTRYDGPGHKDDYAADLAVDGGGNAFVAGVTRGATTGQDYVALAVSPAGKLKWSWRYDGPGVRDFATGVAVDGGGNCYVTGSSQGKQGTVAAATTKLGRRGTPVWLARLQYGEGRSEAAALVYRRLGDERRLFLTGSTLGLMSTRQDLLIAEVDADTGAKVHSTHVDGGGGDDGGLALAVNTTGAAFAAGWTTDPATDIVHAFAARMSEDGSVPAGWPQTIWLGPDDNEAGFQTIALDAAGNPVCGGYALQPGHGTESYVQSFWPTGGQRWSNVSSGSAAGDDICRAILGNASGVYAAGLVQRTGSGIDGQLKKIEP